MCHPTQGGAEKVEDINNLQCVAQQISRAFYHLTHTTHLASYW